MGDGTFVDVTMNAKILDSGNGYGCAWADYNDDGMLDLYITNQNSQSVLYKNNGDGTFENVTYETGLSNVVSAIGGSWGDVDNDGDLDLYVSNLWENHNYLFFNNGEGNFFFHYTGVGLPGNNITNATFGDYDNDGFLDLVVIELKEGQYAPRLYHNMGNSNHWLVVNLIGSISNKSAIGAKVYLFAGNTTQFREVSGGCGDYTFDSLPVEFGVGQSSFIDSLIILWPSSIKQKLTKIEPDQIMTIIEARETIIDTNKIKSEPPTDFSLSQNFPNPFNSTTAIKYQLPVDTYMELGIYNCWGQKIRILAAGYSKAN